MNLFSTLLAALAALAAPEHRTDSPVAAAATASAPSYADLADLALAAPVVAQVRTVEAIPVKGAQAAGVRPGLARLYVEADVTALLRASEALPARVRYLADVPLDARGRAPKIPKGSAFLVFAAPVADRAGELRLVAPDAQLPASARAAELVRAIVREAVARSSPPKIVGVGRAFHSRGNLPGESETQIFVHTADGRPVSLSILRRPGQTPRWAVALSEVVDESATVPRPETLLWYRLACGLPHSVPARSLEDADAAAASAIRRDYQLVLDALGPCGRTRPAR